MGFSVLEMVIKAAWNGLQTAAAAGITAIFYIIVLTGVVVIIFNVISNYSKEYDRASVKPKRTIRNLHIVENEVDENDFDSSQFFCSEIMNEKDNLLEKNLDDDKEIDSKEIAIVEAMGSSTHIPTGDIKDLANTKKIKSCRRINDLIKENALNLEKGYPSEDEKEPFQLSINCDKYRLYEKFDIKDQKIKDIVTNKICTLYLSEKNIKVKDKLESAMIVLNEEHSIIYILVPQHRKLNKDRIIPFYLSYKQ